MFNLSTQEVVLSIENSSLVNLEGLLYQEYTNFFGKNFISPDIKGRSFVKLEKQEHLPRVRLDYNDDLMKKIRIFFMNKKITDALAKKFNTYLKFESVDIWVDNKNYSLDPHIDDSRIKLALQIYLGDDNKGTSLYRDGNIVKTFEYNFNSGYALLNNQKSLHGIDGNIDKDGRISLYARYS